MGVTPPVEGTRRSTLAAEAARLQAIVVAHADALRAGRLGTRFDLEGAAFSLFGKARNTIYRVSWQSQWFLKLTSSGATRIMPHEQLGADTVERAVGDCPTFLGDGVSIVNVPQAFVLASAIPGRPLNRIFYTGIWLPVWAGPRRIDTQFHTLGQLLATLHTRAVVPAGAPAATTAPFDTVKSLLASARGTDDLMPLIAAWYDRRRRDDRGPSFIHGNFRFDNILSDGLRLGLLDYENCGTGSTYQDLSRPVSELLLTRTLPLFPRRRVTRCVRRFLDGYASVRPFESDLLWDFVGARISRYYLETRAKSRTVKIGGLPISRARLAGLTRRTLTESVDEVWPGVRPGAA